jgi:ligand-binding SRPBCC domain-containing protein
MFNITYLPQSKEYRLDSELWLPRAMDEVFPFFADAHNLEAITPDLLQFRLVERERIDMVEGRLIDYRLKIHGVPVKWKSRIPVWDPPHKFVDEQLKGPYLKWYHEHLFAEKDGGTLVTDIVHYKPPGGRLMNWLVVERDVRKIFSFRSEALRLRFPGYS